MAEQTTGRLEQANGRWRLRFTRPLAHPPEKVWRAITEPEHLRAWFPQRVTGDWVTGATLTFSDAEGRGPDFDGQVLAVEPPRLLEFRWGTDVLRLEVAPADGGSTLTLLDTIGELGKAARDSAGWHVCLDNLGAHLDGQPPAPAGERWLAVHAGYVESFGPEAAAVGPPPGYDPRA
jgi:uncharacterized protein YndB with AHSA1/START domain